VLQQIASFDVSLLPALVQRWKIMADCAIHEKEKPQDGRVLIKAGEKTLDLRVSFLPACLGESVTARVLDASVVRLKLEQMDYEPWEQGFPCTLRLVRRLALPFRLHNSGLALLTRNRQFTYPACPTTMTRPDFSNDPRIPRMYFLDSFIIVVSLVVTWVTLLFVLREAIPLAADPVVKQIMVVAAAAAGIASTAALVAVLVHLRGHRQALYSEDLAHQAAMEDSENS
jgi:hypothetical protein